MAILSSKLHAATRIRPCLPKIRVKASEAEKAKGGILQKLALSVAGR
jgi:hypothetical protein